MKTLLVCAVVWFGCLSALPDDQSAIEFKSSTPYDRCMAQFEGSEHIDQCAELKI
jgi:hypothetical protein